MSRKNTDPGHMFVVREWSFRCPGCDAYVDIYPAPETRPQAAKEARERGCRLRDGLWHCENCVNKEKAADRGGR